MMSGLLTIDADICIEDYPRIIPDKIGAGGSRSTALLTNIASQNSCTYIVQWARKHAGKALFTACASTSLDDAVEAQWQMCWQASAHQPDADTPQWEMRSLINLVDLAGKMAVA